MSVLLVSATRPNDGNVGSSGVSTSNPFDAQSSDGSDDAIQGPSSGAVTLDDGTIAVKKGGWGGFRFTGLLIPKGATTTSATLSLNVPLDKTDSPRLTTWGQG